MSIDLKKAKVVYKNTLENAKNEAIRLASALGCSYIGADDIDEGASLFIVVGGDGTLLKCARKASALDTPVFGFNMGRLGFLSQANLNEAYIVFEKLRKGEYRIEERLMLSDSQGNAALNDIVIKNAECSRTSNLELYLNSKPVCSYLADGLIVSTPTGSTAYNLSAGGAVIAPSIECITIVPICAHTLSARPIIVSKDDIVEIRTKDEKADFQLIIDGQSIHFSKNSITIKKHSKKSKLLLLNNQHREFYDILRDKLHWGVAPQG